MGERTRGTAATLLSAALFGIAPIMGRITYDGGSNGAMLTLLRAAMGLPVLWLILRLRRIPVAVSRRNLRDLLIMGVLGSATSTGLYYISYNYIPVGLATLLNCTYPVFVVLFSILFFRERATKTTVLALLLSTAGVVLFSELTGGGSLLGILLALLSAVSFAFVMHYQYRSSLAQLHPLLLSFWLGVVVMGAMLVYSLLAGQFTLALTGKAWAYTFGIAVAVAVGAQTLLQYGVRRVGPAVASILSMLEPIISVVLGVLVLGESMTLRKLAGCALILGAVALLTVPGSRRAAETVPEEATTEEAPF